MTQAENLDDYARDFALVIGQLGSAVSEADTVEEAFLDTLRLICGYTNWPLGHAWIWSPLNLSAPASEVWFAADPILQTRLQRAGEDQRSAAATERLSTLREQNMPLHILGAPNIDSAGAYPPAAVDGLQAYFAFPVSSGGEVLAVLEFYAWHATAAEEAAAALINHAATLLGLYLRSDEALNLLERSDERLAEAQRTAHVGLWEWNIDEDEITWSPELYRIYGLQPEAFDSNYQSFLALVDPDDQLHVHQKLESAQQFGRPFDYFHRILRPDGSQRVIHSRGGPLMSSEGRVTKLYATSQDMTIQEETELELAKTIRTLSTLLEVGRTVSSMAEPETVHTRVLALIRPLIRAEVLALYLLKDGALEVAAFDTERPLDNHAVRIKAAAGILDFDWKSDRSLHIKGAECVARLSQPFREGGYQPQAVLAVPVSWREQTMGVLQAAHRNEEAFDKGDMQLLAMVAAWLAIALENANHYGQIERRLVESEALLAINSALTETLELDEVLHLITQYAEQLVENANRAAIHLLQPGRNLLELVASVGLDIAAGAYDVNVGEGIAGRVIAHGNVINVPDVLVDPRRLPVDDVLNARSLLVAPVESRMGRIGAISVHSLDVDSFDSDDARLLAILGLQAGVAIENARLYAAERAARQKAERQRERSRHMARRVLEAQEKERARIAGELHDESGQALTSLKISLDLLRSQVPEEMADLRQNLESLIDLADTTMTNLRMLSHNLRPPGLEIYGLNAALEGLCQDIARYTSLEIQYEGIDLPDLAPLPAIALYRFVQEALTNTAKHAAATAVNVRLQEHDGRISLTVEDNGRGFDVPEPDENASYNGIGLEGMQERLEMAGGGLEIVSVRDRGTLLKAEVPYLKEET